MNKFLCSFIAFFCVVLTIFGQELESQSEGSIKVKMKADAKYMDDLGNELSEQQFNDSLASGTYIVTVSNTAMKLKKKRPNTSKLIGSELPSILYADMNGNMHKIGDKKNPALIVLWDKTCAPCLEELIELNKVAPDYPTIRFYALAAITKEDVESFLKKQNLQLDNLIIIPEYKKDYQQLLNTSIVPINILIDREQRIQCILMGNNVKAVKEAIDNWK